jgi:TolB-like protein/class 3 adenylate cyclase/Flp pilus assembly protein TadD
MAAEHSSKSRLEVAHVLFVDIVGYSKLLIDEQSAIVAQLNEVVRATEHFRASEANGKLISLPTGDGMALAFFNSPETPVHCAIEIAKSWHSQPETHLRMAIHSGPVELVTDVNGRKNIAGAGINVAQRLLHCADADHILLSKRIAEDLEQYERWRPHLHPIGEVKLKHERKISVVNLYADDFGNSHTPLGLKAKKAEWFSGDDGTEGGKKRSPLLYALLLLPLVVGAIVSIHRLERMPKPPAESPFVPEKSIAVLPFDNFSDDNQNTYFADGIQDDILTALAKVSDLKVISRSSVMQYRGAGNKNVRQIGQALGVAYVLEGSVRRYKGKIRITAQLIDTRTDVHTWAEYYDRSLADVFAIQSEVAEKIAAELKANISASEKRAINVQPTQDLDAFDIYLQAKELINNFHDTPNWKETLEKSLRLLEHAVSRDPNFALAYCLAARAHDALYWYGLDRTPARLAEAKTMTQRALDIAPTLGEAHLVQALVHYHGNRDYARAREELAIARRTLPNNAEMYSLTGWIDRRQGQWNDAIRNEEKAVELDPGNSQFLNSLSILYDILRRYDEELAVLARAIAANPDSKDYFNLLRAEVALETGETQSAREGLKALPPTYDPDGATTSTRINLALYEGDPAAAAKILEATRLEELVGSNGLLLPRAWFEALIARAQDDFPKARAAFGTVREKIAAKLQIAPDDASLLGILGLTDAALGRNAEAVAGGRRALELRPLDQDAVDGASVITTLAMIYSWVGDIDAAIQELTRSATIPGGVDYGQLKFDPAWRPLRGDPRYASILEGLRVASTPNGGIATR